MNISGGGKSKVTDIEKISVGVHDALVSITNTLTLPTHKTLLKTFKLSVTVTAISFLSNLIGFYTFISWQGALLCTCMLFVFLYMERRNNDELLRVYGSAKLRAEEAIRRAKGAGAGLHSRRVTNDSGESTTSTGEGERPDDNEHT